MRCRQAASCRRSGARQAKSCNMCGLPYAGRNLAKEKRAFDLMHTGEPNNQRTAVQIAPSHTVRLVRTLAIGDVRLQDSNFVLRK